MFGLHPNAEIGYSNNAIKGMWRDLIDLQPRTAGKSGAVSREEFIAGVAKGVQAKIPEQVDLPLVRKQRDATPAPTQIVLLQEVERWNILIKTISTTLIDLQRALIGEIA